ncbi:aminoacyl-tRNA hydrolase [Synechococcales cyanobacterium C]|uniref:Peptidyl-tRNA hydrolase n=1 Tax=Petrachloros mirabilis ULC683 TaxID=2781853 RepID=A0A8K1ZVN2_9CYAN|nr:aminoacyl-tRNA hydrolase [Petrachloros mirabilis]NCJ06060.1 aminoacyl-tRNA hydrolase [Petrachloros mirabilis ULC683]
MAEARSELVLPSVIVGLGNPGAKYAHTRHNVGFDVVEALAQRWQISLSEQRRFQGELGEGLAMAGRKVRLLKPLTFMNRSGQSVRAIADWYKLSPPEILVIYDDMDLPVGKLRLRLSGSAGTHNGMKSIVSHLGTSAFPRLRLGIGDPRTTAQARDTVSHVLSRFSPDEIKVMSEVQQQSLAAIELSLKQGVEAAMNRYNGLTFSEII